MRITLFYRGSTSIRIPEWKPIENTSQALFMEYHRLYDIWWYVLDEDDIARREKVATQMDNIYAELKSRKFFEESRNG